MSISSALPPTTRQRARHRLVAVDAVGDDEASAAPATAARSSSPSMTGDGRRQHPALGDVARGRRAHRRDQLLDARLVQPRAERSARSTGRPCGYAGLITMSLTGGRDVGQDVGLAAPPGLDRPSIRSSPSSAPAQRRQERHQRRRLHDAAAEDVGDGDVAVARRLHQPRHAQQRLRPQLERIAVVVVQAAQDDVDRVQATQRLEEHAPVAHGEIAALDQRVAEVLGQERLLEVRRVVRPGGQQHDARVLAPVRRQRGQRLAQRAEEQRQPLGVAFAERLGQHPAEHDPVLERVACPGRRLGPVGQHAQLARRACAPGRPRRSAGSGRRAAMIPGTARSRPGCASTISGGSSPSAITRRGP